MVRTSLLAVFMSLLMIDSARAAGAGITYHGRILKPDGTPVTSLVQFRLQVRSPGNENCLMYEELKSQDLSTTAGVFALTLNDGFGSRVDTSGYTIDQVFANKIGSTFTLTGLCSVGNTYIPNLADGRRIAVSFNDGGGWETLNPQSINQVPMAIESMQVGGFQASSLLRINGGTITAFSPAQGTELTALIGGTSTQYSKPSDLAALSVSGDASGLLSALSVDKIKGRTIAPTTPSTGEVLKWNGVSWAPAPDMMGGAGSLTMVTASTPLISSGGTTPNISLANGTLTGQTLRWNGSAWTANSLNYTDLKNNVAASPWPTVACAADEYVTWSSAADAFVCQSFPTATAAAKGLVQIGAGLSVASGVISLPDVVSTGTFTKVTVDTKGRVTNGGNLIAGDLTSILGYIPLNPANNLNDVASVATSRTNLGLGTSATLNVAAAGNAAVGEVVKGNDTRLSDSRAPNGSAGGDLTGTYPSPTLTTTGVGAGTYTKVTVDTKGRVLSATTIGASDVTTALSYTPVNQAGDTMAGTLSMGGNALTNIGDMTMAAQKTLMLGAYDNTQETTLTSGLGTGDKGKTWFNSQTAQIKYWNGSTAVTVGVSGSGLSNFNGLTGATQSLAIGTSGTTAAWSSVGTTHTLNIPNAASTGVTRGLVSKTDYDLMMAKQDALGFTPLNPANNLSDLTTPSAARSNLGLGTAATKAFGTSAGNLVELDAGGKILASVLPSSVMQSGASAGGDLTGTFPNPTLASTGVGAGTYKSVTVDAKGRVTAGTNPTTLSGYGITDSVQNMGGTPSIQSGLDAGKGAGSTAGRIWVATDTKKVYRDNGSTWDIIGTSNAADLSGTLATAQLPTVPVTKGGTGLTALGSSNQVLGVDNAGTGAEYKTITAGANITVTHGAGTITIAGTGSSGVTNVATGTGLTGGPITGTGTISIASGGVSATELASNAVTTVKILDAAVTTPKLFSNPGVNRIVGTDASTGAALAPLVCSSADQVLKWTVATGWQCDTVSNLISATAGGFIKDGGNTTGANISIGANDNRDVNIKSDNLTRMTVASTGNVGIGTTTTASYKLTVNGYGYVGDETSLSVLDANATFTVAGSTDPVVKLFDNRPMAQGVGGSLSFMGYDGATDRTFAVVRGGKENGASGDFGGYFAIQTRPNGGSLTEYMRVSSTGNVGIGTTTPSVALDMGARTDAIRLPVGNTAAQPASPQNGMMRYNSQTNKFEAYENGGWTNIIGGGSITSFNGLNAAVQTFSTPGLSGTAPSWSSAGSAHTLNIPMASAASVTAGLISKTDYDNFNTKLGTIPNVASLAATKIWVGDGTGKAQEVSMSVDATISSAGAITIASNAITTNKINANAVTTPKLFSNPGMNRLVATDSSTGATLAPIVCGSADQVLKWTVATGWQCDSVANIIPVTANGFIKDGGNTTGANISIGANDNRDVNIKSNNLTRMTVASTGFVGVGTTSPISLFHVDGSAASVTSTIANNSNAGYANLEIFGSGGGGSLRLIAQGSGNTSWGIPAATQGLQFQGNSFSVINTGLTTLMRITSGGNVGIGVATPSVSLDISGRTDAIRLPVGNTAAQPGTPTNGMMRYNSQTNKFEAYENGGWTNMIGGGGGMTSLNGLSTAVQTFSTPATTGTAPNWVSSGSGHTLNIPIASASSVTAGLISKTDYDNFNTKLSTIPNVASLAATKIWVGDGTGKAQEVSMSVDATISSAGAITIASNAVTTAKINANAVTTPKLFSNPGINRIVATDSSTGATLAPLVCGSADQVLKWTVATGWQCDTVSNLVSSTAGGFIKDGGNSTGANISVGTNDNRDFSFKSNNLTRVTVASTGNVGIGSTSPTRRLEVVGPGGGYYNGLADFSQTGDTEFSVTSADGNRAWLYLNSSGNRGYAIVNEGGGASSQLGIHMTSNINSNAEFAFTYDGKMGIGTTQGSVGAPLHVNVPDTAGNSIIEGMRLSREDSNSAAASGIGVALTFNLETATNNTFREAARIEGVWDDATNNSKDGSLRFSTMGPNAASGATTTTERMRIDSSGNVGIGTTTPSVALDIGARTDAIRLPSGNTAAQPASPANGMMRYNSQTNKFEAYEAGGWTNMIGGGGAPAGADTQIQYNNAGAAGASNLFTWNNTSKVLSVLGGTAYSGSSIVELHNGADGFGNKIQLNLVTNQSGSALRGIANNQVGLSSGPGADVILAPNQTETVRATTSGLTVTGAVSATTAVSAARFKATGTATTVSSCGTSPTISGNSTRGTVIFGTGGVTSCTIGFAAPFVSTPTCVVSAAMFSPGVYVFVDIATTTNSQLVIKTSGDASGKVFSYICIE